MAYAESASSSSIKPGIVIRIRFRSTLLFMRSTVQARLDAETSRDLARLIRNLGWTPSQVVREALHRMAASDLSPKRPRVVGTGKFSSGIPDLGSNEKHLKGFGG